MKLELLLLLYFMFSSFSVFFVLKISGKLSLNFRVIIEAEFVPYVNNEVMVISAVMIIESEFVSPYKQ